LRRVPWRGWTDQAMPSSSIENGLAMVTKQQIATAS
jgi:hypothetical protein